jgi:hypothetical protein
MPVNGYILIDGEKWLVSAENRRRDLALERRSEGEDGVHLEDVQAFLNLPQHRWLKDPLRYGVTVYLPMYSLSVRPPPSAANGI